MLLTLPDKICDNSGCEYFLGEKVYECELGASFTATNASRNSYILKVVYKSHLNSQNSMSNVKDQIAIFELYNHCAVISPYVTFEDDSYFYILFDVTNYRTLKDLVLKESSLEQEIAFYIAVQLFNLAKFLHSKKVVHGDINLDNVLIDANLNIKLVDFKFSAFHDSGIAGRFHTRENETSIPEINKGKYYDSNSDFFSTATILYTLISGVSLLETEKNMSTSSGNLFSKSVRNFLEAVINLNTFHNSTVEIINSYIFQSLKLKPLTLDNLNVDAVLSKYSVQLEQAVSVLEKSHIDVKDKVVLKDDMHFPINKDGIVGFQFPSVERFFNVVQSTISKHKVEGIKDFTLEAPSETDFVTLIKAVNSNINQILEYVSKACDKKDLEELPQCKVESPVFIRRGVEFKKSKELAYELNNFTQAMLFKNYLSVTFNPTTWQYRYIWSERNNLASQPVIQGPFFFTQIPGNLFGKVEILHHCIEKVYLNDKFKITAIVPGSIHRVVYVKHFFTTSVDFNEASVFYLSTNTIQINFKHSNKIVISQYGRVITLISENGGVYTFKTEDVIAVEVGLNGFEDTCEVRDAYYCLDQVRLIFKNILTNKVTTDEY
ncbi:kinase-like protein [Conidiobolus coronatus NRRL 28638]|uniref:Kinase-like protein n=1 Tax=Conidiobolus coronatus (strain ATCC 28846 / CBS 209.66 / NRRL 28638) TaxID=796925 RepID=A0A137P202_CONC2|nr:kinase-like protein [Conidiobolus coronatus NRRL 28638]|eukprot:KXN69086.1 kinase-like protein [Conidiobolus coronatus NRRL 28638]